MLLRGQYTQWRIEPLDQGIENDYLSGTISPADYSPAVNGFRALNLILRNNTSEDMELDWNKTLFIENGQTNGGFMFEGVVYQDKNNPKQPDIIFPDTEFKKTIWPNNLVSFRGNSWDHNAMPPGQNGIYLTIRTKKNEIKEKVVLNMSKVPIQDIPLGAPEYKDWTGVGVDDITGFVRVVRVNDRGAAFSKIVEGDVIIEVNRKPVRNIPEYKFAIENLKGSTVLYLISRSGKSYYVSVKPK